MAVNIQKCAIIGCGFVGATTAYTLTQSELFSEIVLIDIDRKKAEGEAMDIVHGLPFLSPIKIYAGDYSDLSDAAIIIITAGANQKPGQTRTDLVKTNVKIFHSIVDNVVKYNREGILLVVTNPVDILTYVTWRVSGFPSNRVIGSGTVLDTARMKQLVGQQLGVDARNVHTFIIGEHGDSELAVWSSANISGIDLDTYCAESASFGTIESLHGIYDEVKNSAYRIIEAKGATYYAVAQAVKRICTAIIRNERTIMPVSAYLDGEYGFRELCMSMPSIVGRDGIKKVIEIKLDEKERSYLESSAKKLSSIIKELEEDGLLDKN
ncbi:MAG: L-lactate dehydrogenase [Ruminococcaceae bacterium]|nr:L-lactate dehydrogenase [Oscillospiraceae bacterium]